MRSALCAWLKRRLPSQMLQGSDISNVLHDVPHMLHSPATTTRMSISVLQEHMPVEPLAAFKLTGSLCAFVHVSLIGMLLNSLRPQFDQFFQSRGPRTPLLCFSTLLPCEVPALQ